MFKIYKASAGAGKTTRLVTEYLSLCFKDPRNFRHILAITFTNNATAEMKERIVDTLYSFAFTPFDSLSGSKQRIYLDVQAAAALPDERMAGTASDVLTAILYDYDNFSVSTIDSFFQRILRSFALELGLNMNFNVQVSLDEFYQQTVDILLNRISAENKELSWRVLNVVQQKMAESGRWNIERDLLNFLPVIYAEDSYLPLQKLSECGADELKNFYQSLQKKCNELKTKVEEVAKKGNATIGERPSTDFIQGKKGVYTFFDKILDNPFALPAHAYVTNCMNNGTFTHQDNPSLFAALADCVSEIESLVPQLSETLQILKPSRVLLLLLDLKSIMDEIKLRDNLFYLSETNTKLFSEIKDEEAPYIYEKLGNKYAFFFIDEFQDTSKFQWENLMPLVRTALSQPAPYTHRKDETGAAILFGDVKQSIYRFRNGDASLLNTLSTHAGADQMLYSGQSSIPDSDYKVEPLDHNYRSSENVIKFNNGFFSFLKDNSEEFPLGGKYYDDVCQKIPEQTTEKKRDGFVSVMFDDDRDDNYLYTQILSSVKNALERGYSYADMAVLSRGRAQSNMIACELSKCGIPVISNESLLLKSSDRVNLIIAVVRYVNSSDDTLSKFIIIDFLVKNKRLKKDLAGILQKTENGNPFREDNFVKLLAEAGVIFDRKRIRKFPLFTAMVNICNSFLINENDVFVATFMDYVLEQMPSGDMAISAFLDWWEQNSPKLSVSSAKGINAVTINTIHSAKGLEYPVLIFPMMMYRAVGGKDYLWCDNPDYQDDKHEVPVLLLGNNKDLEGTRFGHDYKDESELTTLDVLNIIYVAMTRASDCMYVITGNAEKRSNFAKLLFGFINSRKLDFIEDEKDTNRYWFGNRDWKKEKRDASEAESENVLSEGQRLFASDFVTEKLVIHENTPEQEVGTYVHDFLASLKTFPQNEQELEAVAATAQAEYRDRVGQALRNILEERELAPYFAPQVRCLNEISIATPPDSDGKTEVFRPDRIVVFGNSVTVIDYKTGQYHEEYEKQLQKYCLLLEQMGYNNVNYKLVFV